MVKFSNLRQSLSTDIKSSRDTKTSIIARTVQDKRDWKKNSVIINSDYNLLW